MNETELRTLSGAEVMSWNINQVPQAVAESDGPLVVKLRGDVVRMFRWYMHPRLIKGLLQVCDTTANMRVVAEYETGQWDEAIHDYKFAGLY